MSLTCNFRRLADQVKHRLSGANRRRSSSSGDCHCSLDSRLTEVETRPHPRVASCNREGDNADNIQDARYLQRTMQRGQMMRSYMSDSVESSQHMQPTVSQVDGRFALDKPMENNRSVQTNEDQMRTPRRPSQQNRRCTRHTVTLAGPSDSRTRLMTDNNHSDSAMIGQPPGPPVSTGSNFRDLAGQGYILRPHDECASVSTSNTTSNSSALRTHSCITTTTSGEPTSPMHPVHPEKSPQASYTSRSPRSPECRQRDLVFEQSYPENELRSGSLGSALPCFIGHSKRSHRHRRYLTPLEDPTIQDMSRNMQQMTMSYAGLPLSYTNDYNANHRGQMHAHSHTTASPICSQSTSINTLRSSSNHIQIDDGSLSSMEPSSYSSVLSVASPTFHRSHTHRSPQNKSCSTSVQSSSTHSHTSSDGIVPVLPARSSSLLIRAWNSPREKTLDSNRLVAVPTIAELESTTKLERSVHSYSNQPLDAFRVVHSRSQSAQIQPSSIVSHNVSPSPLLSQNNNHHHHHNHVLIPEVTIDPPNETHPMDTVAPSRHVERGTSSPTALERSTEDSSMSTRDPLTDPLEAPSDLLTTSIILSISETAMNEQSSDIALPNVPNSSSCGQLEQFMPTNHASRLLGRMSNKLRDGRLADVTLLAGHKLLSRTYNSNLSGHGGEAGNLMEQSIKDCTPVVRIPAHRVILAAASDYFAAMFGNEVKEATESDVWIREVEPNALQTLVDYIYTGHLDIREETVEDLLEAACFLQIPEASQACERFLIKRLHGSNCLGMSRLGEQHGCHLLRREATKYALEHFTEVVSYPDFLSRNASELIELLSSDHLSVQNEASVFAACLRWVRLARKRDRSIGLVKLSHLLKFVRLQQLPARLLVEVLEKEPLIQEDKKAVCMLISALRFHLVPDSKSSGSISESLNEPKRDEGARSPMQGQNQQRTSPRSDREALIIAKNEDVPCSVFSQAPRPSTIGRLWALGGKTMTTTRALQEILEYDPYWNTWTVVGQLPGQRQQCGCIMLKDGRLLVVGGRDELKTLSTVECVMIEEFTSHPGRINQKHRDERISHWNNSDSASLSRAKCNAALLEQDSHSLSRSVIETRSETGAVESRGTQDTNSSESAVGAPPGWHVVSAMATHRHGLGVAVLEGVVYAVGGHDGWSYLNTVERWNGRAKSWSPVTPMAVQRSTVGVAALDGLLYAVGGRDGSACLRTVERFNPHTQHWCFIAPMLHRRGGVGVGAVGGRLYAVGGHNAPPSQPQALRTASVEMYEPATDMWTEVACLNSPRDSIAVTTMGMKLYAIGGHDGQVYTDWVQVYDPEKNRWSDEAPFRTWKITFATGEIVLVYAEKDRKGNGYIGCSFQHNSLVVQTDDLSFKVLNISVLITLDVHGYLSDASYVMDFVDGTMFKMNCFKHENELCVSSGTIVYAHRIYSSLLVQNFRVFNPLSEDAVVKVNKSSIRNWPNVQTVRSIQLKQKNLPKHSEPLETKYQVVSILVREPITDAVMRDWRGKATGGSDNPGSIVAQAILVVIFEPTFPDTLTVKSQEQSTEHWAPAFNLNNITNLVSLWHSTFEKSGCSGHFRDGVHGLLQVALSHLGHLRQLENHVSFEMPPEMLNRDMQFRRLQLSTPGVYVTVQVRIIPGKISLSSPHLMMVELSAWREKCPLPLSAVVRMGKPKLQQPALIQPMDPQLLVPIKPQPSEGDKRSDLLVTVEREAEQVPVFICSAGCVEEPLEVKYKKVVVPFLITNPESALLYLGTDNKLLKERAQLIKYKDIQPGPNPSHDLITLHRHGHAFGGLPWLFWISLGLLITLFHLFFFKLIYNELIRDNSDIDSENNWGFTPTLGLHAPQAKAARAFIKAELASRRRHNKLDSIP